MESTQPVLRAQTGIADHDHGARFYLAAALILCALGMAAIVSAYWPGVMIDDGRWQYQQSVDNAFEDWHPPLMAWIWRQFMFLLPGPGPMLILQLLLYWGGIALISSALYRRGSPRSALAAACAGWIPAPFALEGSVTKDWLMAGALIMGVGLSLWSSTADTRGGSLAFAAAAILALFFAAALRVNAFLACVPLLLAVLPRAFTSTPSRAALAAVASAAIFFVTPAAIAAALQAEDTDEQLSLIIFDLGGMTEHSGVNQFPDLHVANPVAVNHRCYDPYQWDSYSTWAKRPCPLGFERFQALVDEGDIDPRSIWLHAIVSHPLAYAEHRLAYYNLSTWFLVPDSPKHTAWTHSFDNPWGFRVRQNAILQRIDATANAAAMTPLGWPVFWIAMSLGVLILCLSARLSAIASSVAASAFLYGAGYVLVGVATGMRYYVWTIIGAALAAVLAGTELRRTRDRTNRFAISAAAAIVAIPTAMAAVARAGL